VYMSVYMCVLGVLFVCVCVCVLCMCWGVRANFALGKETGIPNTFTMFAGEHLLLVCSIPSCFYSFFWHTLTICLFNPQRPIPLESKVLSNYALYFHVSVHLALLLSLCHTLGYIIESKCWWFYLNVRVWKSFS